MSSNTSSSSQRYRPEPASDDRISAKSMWMYQVESDGRSAPSNAATAAAGRVTKARTNRNLTNRMGFS